MNAHWTGRTAAARTRVVVLGGLEVSVAEDETLITYALGSCLAVCIYDPVARVGGMLHAMLPRADQERRLHQREYAKYIDTGVPLLFKRSYALGAEKRRIIVKVAGGASVAQNANVDRFQIGQRNFIELKRLLWRNGVLISAHDVGGTISRTVSLHIGTGTLVVRSNGVAREL